MTIIIILYDIIYTHTADISRPCTYQVLGAHIYDNNIKLLHTTGRGDISAYYI